MAKIIWTIAAVYASFAAGILIHSIYIKYLPREQQNKCALCTRSDELRLEDFDIVVSTLNSPYKLLHINSVKNRVQNYEHAQLVYANSSGKFQTTMVPFSAVEVKQKSRNPINREYYVKAKFKVDKDEIILEIPKVALNMVIRAQPYQAKYGGATNIPDAKVIINGVTYMGYGALTAAFFSEFVPVDIEEYGVKTKWLMYWDAEWNFYHLDLSEVAHPTSDYYAHKFFAKINIPTGRIDYIDTADALINYPNINIGGILDLTSVNEATPYHKAVAHLVEGYNGGTGILFDLDYAR